MSCKFRFDNTVPEDVRTIVGRYLLPLEWMIPAWCAYVMVYWNSQGDDDDSMRVTVNFEYRFAQLTVRPAFVETAEEFRGESCIHELIHLHVNPLYNYADRTLGILLHGDEQHKTSAQEELRRYVEGVTQDLTDTVFRRLQHAAPESAKGVGQEGPSKNGRQGHVKAQVGEAGNVPTPEGRHRPEAGGARQA